MKDCHPECEITTARVLAIAAVFGLLCGLVGFSAGMKHVESGLMRISDKVVGK